MSLAGYLIWTIFPNKLNPQNLIFCTRKENSGNFTQKGIWTDQFERLRKAFKINWEIDAVLLVMGLRMDGNLPYVSISGTRGIRIGFLRRNEAGRHQKCRVTARKEMKHVKASSEDEEPLNTSLFFYESDFWRSWKRSITFTADVLSHRPLGWKMSLEKQYIITLHRCQYKKYNYMESDI